VRKLNVIIFLLLSIPAIGRNYYVKNSGNDSNSGLSDTQAWKTLSKVSGFTFSAGDSILFNRGDVWRESLTVHNSGTSSSYITYGSYGHGDKPKIYGSIQAARWSNIAGNIWTSAITLPDPASGNGWGTIYFVETSGNVTWGHAKKTFQEGFGNLTSEYD